jgi:hypothetical protein
MGFSLGVISGAQIAGPLKNSAGLYNRRQLSRFCRHVQQQPLQTTTRLAATHAGTHVFKTSRSISMSNLFEATALVVPFENLRMTDVDSVGGKNASLGEMISQLPTGPKGVRVPTGFATTAHAFRVFLAHAGLDKKINGVLDKLDTEDVRALAAAGAQIRALVEAQPFPADFEAAIRDSLQP